MYWTELNQYWTDWNWISTLLPIVELLIAELNSFQTGELHTVIDLNWLELNNDTIVFRSCLTAESELSPLLRFCYFPVYLSEIALKQSVLHKALQK